jgi:hypothetical protein
MAWLAGRLTAHAVNRVKDQDIRGIDTRSVVFAIFPGRLVSAGWRCAPSIPRWLE